MHHCPRPVENHCLRPVENHCQTSGEPLPRTTSVPHSDPHPAVMDSPGLLSLTLALLGVLSPCLTLLTPRVSFPMGVPGRRVTRYRSHGASNTTTLLLSGDGDTLYVGARDAVLALDVSYKDAITLRRKVGELPLITLSPASLRRELISLPYL
ncbi:Semaphorin-4A [Liparis tanakae]|uniref:Semaphorin-4A n=1 Tax=Liparis tanakae TaxID=230148 RepID=A0A4Z2GP56_9TELE|nr:Semaphorin-4A [Liparis tanakae]